jgi:hypothetical protein
MVLGSILMMMSMVLCLIVMIGFNCLVILNNSSTGNINMGFVLMLSYGIGDWLL